MIYRIKNIFLLVENEISEYDEIIYGRFSQFNKKSNIKVDNYLKFKKNEVNIKIKGKEIKLKAKIIKTDIYVIINNVISYIINDEYNIYMHSVVVANSKKKGILIIGNFGQGKTTLANEFIKYGYRIHSSDQTWLKINKRKIKQVLGSRFYYEDSKIKFLNKKDVKEKIEIDKIIRIVGLANNSDTIINEEKNINYKVKQASDYCNWTNISVIFTDDVNLYNVQKFTKDFLLKILDIKFYNVRGDKCEIVNKIKEE